MTDQPRSNAELELICPRCGYHTIRTAERLRRPTKIVCASCGSDILSDGDGGPDQDGEHDMPQR
jgi:DNA-directed RNA polymerase subunit RPC12/RpoP